MLISRSHLKTICHCIIYIYIYMYEYIFQCVFWVFIEFIPKLISCSHREIIYDSSLYHYYLYVYNWVHQKYFLWVHSAWAWECTDCFSAASPNECPLNDTKQSDGEAPVMLELWRIQTTPLLPSHPGPLWTGVVEPDRVLPMGQIELNSGHMLNWIV